VRLEAPIELPLIKLTSIGKVDFADISDQQLLGTLVKTLLKEHPEPIMTFALYDAFATVAELKDAELKGSLYKYLIRLLPSSHRQLLYFFFHWMHELVTFMNLPDSGLGGVNSTTHMASTFGALVFRTKSTEISLDAYKKQKSINSVVQLFIDKGFDGMKLVTIYIPFVLICLGH
jgi:hypothetical protein